MIKRIIKFSAENRILVLLGVAALCVFAWQTLHRIRLDALPDLSDTQVIIYSRWYRSPDIIEDQVTYPIITALLGAPKVKAIRGYSDFGFSYVYVIFQDGTDLYWARSRVLEYLSKIQPQLPQGVRTELGPDATGVGWVFQYALVDRSGKHSLEELRAFQDWTLRYALQSVPGVAEVASIGGFVKQYQITVDPNRLAAFNLPLRDVVEAIRKANNEVGGRLLEFAGAEYMVRGKGYARSIADFESIVLKTTPQGVPVRLSDVGRVELGPEIRRGVADLDGLGDHVGGIVVMRHGENALNVIKLVKAKLEELAPSLPEGVEVVTTYDRSDLIQQAIVLILVGSIGILLWITLRFHDVKMGVAALVALLHDVVVVVGIFAILGTVFRIEIDGFFVTAMLTVIGFSVHDTIVVFDRIRENRTRHAGEPFERIVNHSILQTLGRSINTSFTTVLVLLALLLFGGETIRTFVLAMVIGIVSGTYSSIFNASQILVTWQLWEDERAGRPAAGGRLARRPAR